MRESNVLLHQVEELPDVSRPVRGRQQFDGLGRIDLLLPPRFGGLLQEMRHQQGNILAAASQGRYLNGQNADLVVQLFEKRAGIHQRLEVTRCGADQPHVGALCIPALSRGNGILVQRFGERNLQVDGQIADFIQQQCAAVRSPERPLPRRLRRARFVRLLAEECRLQCIRGRVPARNSDKASLATRTRRMDRTRKKFFSGAVFAGYQRGLVAACGLIGNRQAVFHELTARYEVRAPVTLGQRKG